MEGEDDTSWAGDPGKVNRKQEEARAKYQALVTQLFNTLRATGLSPNEAAAMALKIATHGVELPVDIPSLRQRLQTLSQQEASGQAAQWAPIWADLKRLFSSAETMSTSFKTVPAAADESTASQLNAQLAVARAIFQQTTRSTQMANTAAGSAEALLRKLRLAGSAVSPEHRLRTALILLQLPILDDPDHHGLLSMITEVMSGLPEPIQELAVDVFALFGADEMSALVQAAQQFITIHLYEEAVIDESVEDAVKLLDLANRANNRSKAVPYADFYNDAVNQEDFNVREDYMRWYKSRQREAPRRFSFCAYPFVYDPATKSQILRLENMKEQFEEFHDAMIRQLLTGHGFGACPFLILKVRRSPYLVHDTLQQIQGAAARDALKKPLKVQFIGEEGVDEGGVQKEFFQLLMRDLFDANYGMFTYDEDTRLYWFRPAQLDLAMEFELVGIMLGLAIYNSHILEFSFPMLTYRKLMGREPTFADLAEVHPDIHASLQKLLDYPGSVEDLALVFQVQQAGSFGEDVETLDLLPNGGSIPVTTENRQQYVDLYTRHLLTTSIQDQFTAFQRGFDKLCGSPALQMFRPTELELLICGGRELDFGALQAHTVYEDGFTPESQVIQWFWAIVHGFQEAQKKKLLFFVTGSDRVPIRGLASLSPPFVIMRNGPHSDRLPTAHTCFNHLLLPQYKDRATLESRLLTAINNAEGFGLR